MTTLQNEPVATNGIAAIILAAATVVATHLGIDAEGTAKIVTFGGAGVSAALSIWRIFAARGKVTPIAGTTPLQQAAQLIRETRAELDSLEHVAPSLAGASGARVPVPPAG
jgi:hypothetical protein